MTTGSMRALVTSAMMLALINITTPMGPTAVSAETVPTSAATAAGEVVGQGWGARAMCIGCATLILGAGGGSLLGLAFITAIQPELVFGCGGLCVMAFS